MVLNLIWAPDVFGYQVIWFGPCMKIIIWHFYAGTKLLGAQISRGPNFLGPKKVRGPNEIRDHFSYSPKQLPIPPNKLP